jgi:hypothetical protein
MQAMIKDARFLEIKQAGHISNIEQPIIFNAAVRNFLDDVESRQAHSPWDRVDCVVADAVAVEPVSPPNSLLTGKRAGNFSILSQAAV